MYAQKRNRGALRKEIAARSEKKSRRAQKRNIFFVAVIYMGQTYSSYSYSKANREASKKASRNASRITPCQRAQKSIAAQKDLMTRMRTSPTSSWYTINAISNALNLPEPLVQLQQFRRLSQANQQRKRDDMLREQNKAYANLLSYVRRTCGPTR